jgi:hypothetical protein
VPPTGAFNFTEYEVTLQEFKCRKFHFYTNHSNYSGDLMMVILYINTDDGDDDYDDVDDDDDDDDDDGDDGYI